MQKIEQDKYCPKIIQQADSVIRLIKSVKKELVAGHLDHYLAQKPEQNDSPFRGAYEVSTLEYTLEPKTYGFGPRC